MVNLRIAEILRSGKPDDSLKIQGWVRTKRELKGFSFIEINDGSSLASLHWCFRGSDWGIGSFPRERTAN